MQCSFVFGPDNKKRRDIRKDKSIKSSLSPKYKAKPEPNNHFKSDGQLFCKVCKHMNEWRQMDAERIETQAACQSTGNIYFHFLIIQLHALV